MQRKPQNTQPSEDPKLGAKDPSKVTPPTEHRNRDLDTVKSTGGSALEESVGNQTNSKEGMRHSSQTGRT
ncbi:hypothetical protein J7E62_25065 [Variovorax paradoxus]|nr:hypothetical protein [Variovorax paradoxus]